MSSMTLTLLEMMIWGSPTLRVHCAEICRHFEELQGMQPKPLLANWVVDLDESGNPQVRMRWTARERETTPRG